MLVIAPYEALEDNQINLVDGEYIYDVEPIDDGWWRGITEDGKRGLSPASYVEVATTADGKKGLFPASYVEECAVPNEAEGPPSLHPVRATSNPVTSGMQRSSQSQKKKKRKGKGGDDDSNFSSTALQPESNARGRSAPQNRFLPLEREDGD